jgi:hypothetical protein
LCERRLGRDEGDHQYARGHQLCWICGHSLYPRCLRAHRDVAFVLAPDPADPRCEGQGSDGTESLRSLTALPDPASSLHNRARHHGRYDPSRAVDEGRRRGASPHPRRRSVPLTTISTCRPPQREGRAATAIICAHASIPTRRRRRRTTTALR